MFDLLFSAAATPGAYYAYEVSDGMGKGIVILLLFGSVITWALMIDKGWALYKAKKLSERFNALFNQNKRSIDALAMTAANDPAPLAQVYIKGVARLQEFNRPDPANPDVPKPRLTDEQMMAIEAVLEREVSNQILELETGVSFLATIVSVSPFFGLFGTVWGVMLAFVGMAIEGSADIGAMAPGIASALLTTVVGLIVAIPSVIGYNLITSTIRRVTVYMDNFTEEFMVRIKLDRLDKGN